MTPNERTFWLAAVFFAIALSIVPYILEPRPYWDVEVIKNERVGEYRFLTINFTLSDCIRNSVAFVGSRLGVISDITGTWTDLNGFETGNNRHAGLHTLEGKLFVGDIKYDWIEIRTSHTCGTKTIERVFAHIDV